MFFSDAMTTLKIPQSTTETATPRNALHALFEQGNLVKYRLLLVESGGLVENDVVITQPFAHPLAHSIRQPNLALDRSPPHPAPEIFLGCNGSTENPTIGS